MLLEGREVPARSRGKYEIKYVVAEDSARKFLEAASRWMRPDRHQEAAGGYRVTSLYYDTPELDCYRDTVEGHPTRRKFRLRRYGDAGSASYFEVKSRLARDITKERAPASREEAEAFVRDPFGRRPPGIGEAPAAELARKAHFPTVAVRYDRIALEDLLDSGLRVTLDSNIRCGKPELYGRPASAGDTRVLPPGLRVLEVKFAGRLPAWVSCAVGELGLVARNYSKYAGAVRRAIAGAPLTEDLIPDG